MDQLQPFPTDPWRGYRGQVGLEGHQPKISGSLDAANDEAMTTTLRRDNTSFIRAGRTGTGSGFKLALLALGIAGLCYPAEVSLASQSAAPGSSNVLPIAFLSQANPASGVQFDLEYDNSALSLGLTPGDALRNAGKKIYSANLASNKIRLLLVGTDQSAIADGTLVNLFVTVSPTAPPSAYSLKFSNVVATSPTGTAIPITSVDGTITVQTSTSLVRLQPGGVLNGASLVSGAIAPGEIVTLIGSGIGAAVALPPAGSASSTDLASSQVLFDGTTSPILYTSPNQINAIVPFALYRSTSTQMEVMLHGKSLAALPLSVSPAAPSIFTIDSSGVGQGAILNQDSTGNSAANPAKKGSVVVIFATGAGETDPASIDGQVTGTVLPKPLLPVSVLIGGLTAQVLYAGAAPELIAGVIQVNALVPEGVSSGAAVPVALTVGQAVSPSGVTLAIK